MISKPTKARAALRWASGVLVVASSALTLGIPLASSASAAATALSASPSTQSAPVSGSGTVNVTSTGTPSHLSYTVVSGPDQNFPTGIACTSNTVCTVTNTAAAAGTDTVRVFDDIDNSGALNGSEPTASDVTVKFTGAPTSVAISPHTASQTADNCQAYTVTADDGSTPAGQRRIDVTGTQNTGSGSGTPLSFCTPSGASGTATTDSNTSGVTAPPTTPASNTDTLVGHISTGGDGTATFGIASSAAGTVDIVAASHLNTTISDSATETVTGGQSGDAAVKTLTVTPLTFSGYTGSAVQYKVTATDTAGNPVKGADVHYVISGPDAVSATAIAPGPQCGSNTAAGTGNATCTITNTGGAGTDSITFYVNNATSGTTTEGPDSGEPQQNVTATFTAPPTYTSLAVTCPSSGALATTPDTNACTIPTSQHAVVFTAKVLNGTAPVQGAIVTFTTGGTASSTDATPRTGTATTDATGKATYTVTDAHPADGDTVSATAQIGSGTPSTATATYAAPAATNYSLTPHVQSVANGGSVTEVAKVTDQFGNGVSGQSIDFTVSGRNAIVQTIATGSDGKATLTYTDTGSSGTTDNVAATDTTSGHVFNAATVNYVASVTASSVVINVSGAGNGTTCPSAATQTGASLQSVTTVCALVKNSDGDVLANKSVTFTVSDGAVDNSGDLSDSSGKTVTTTTDGSGIALADVTSTTPGDQTVTATADAANASGTITYSAPAVGDAQNLALTPATADVAPGGSQPFTATVTDQFGNGVGGVPVTFSKGTGPGNFGAVSSVTATTGADGTATATLSTSSTDSGTGTVTASIPDGYTDCGTTGPPAGNCTASSTYTVSTASVAASVTLAAQSGRHVGQNETVTATVKNGDGDAVSNVVVRFSVTGANSTTGAASTNASGKATFTYKAANAGKDTISAFADVNDDGVAQGDEPSATPVKANITKVTEKPTITLKSKSKGHLTVKAVTHPSLAGKTMHFYRVSKSGHRHLLGAKTTGHGGHATKTFKLKAGKKYTIQARIVHVSHITSQFSKKKSEKVKK